MKRDNRIFANISNIWNTDLRYRTTPLIWNIQIEWVKTGKHLIFVNNRLDFIK